MPRSSSALTSDASVYRAGGEVEWPSGSSDRCSTCSPTFRCGQAALGVAVLRLVVAALLVRSEEAPERDHGAGGAELGIPPVGCGRAEPQRDGLPAGILHLRGDRSLPDELVEGVLVARELTLHIGGHPELVAGRTDRLVRLLRVLHLALVAARRGRNELCAVQLCGLRASRRERRLRQRRRVGAHVGDVAVLVEPLRDAHRGLRREAELAARFLLQGRRHEGRRGASGVRLLLDRAHRERGAGEGSRERPRSIFVEREDVAT